MIGTRPLTIKSASRFADSACMDPDLRRKFIGSVAGVDVSNANPKQPLPTKSGAHVSRQIQMDQFHIISDWYHYAILSLGEISSSIWDANFISRRLGITTPQASRAMSRLERLKLVKLRGIKFSQNGSSLKTSEDVSSAAIKKHHRQNLEKSSHSLSADPVAERDFSSVTTAIAHEDIDKAKQLIRKFRKDFLELAEKNTNKERIYNLSVQLFPVDRQDTQKD
jgi:uncharacterized protein (TIGR02147 family)